MRVAAKTNKGEKLMKNTFLKTIISAGVIVASISSLAPLGVSASEKAVSSNWRQSSDYTWSYYKKNNAEKGWKKISNKWYYFDNNGKMKTGWIKDAGKWYYTDSTGVMQTGWIRDAGKWYYTDSTGVMQTGVIKINGKIYYFNKSGAMQTGRVRIGNRIYRFATNGQAIGSILPNYEKEFDSNNNLIKPNNNLNSENITNPDNTGSTENNQNSGGNNSNSESENDSSSGGGITVNGLPSISKKYEVTIQNSAENKILELMNEKRTEAGLQPLTLDTTLQSVARYKSNHMIQNDYFSHTNPDGTKWTNWLQAIGYRYNATAENIAYNSYDPVELFNQWWNSSGHRENMMNPSYTKVGIGVVYGNGKYMGTQTFSN